MALGKGQSVSPDRALTYGRVLRFWLHSQAMTINNLWYLTFERPIMMLKLRQLQRKLAQLESPTDGDVTTNTREKK